MSTEPPQPLDPNFRIELPSFEGPLDLLLHLANKHELEILDLPIAFVTEKYLEYLGLMKRLNLDVASEYLVMAAELARIKSKMLLPQVPEDDEEEGDDEQDPRADLIRRLLEYQKYKRASEDLGARAVAGRDVFYRGAPAPEAEGPAPLADVSVFKLLDALQKVIERTRGDLQFEVTAERISLQDRINEITETLQKQRSCTFEELFEGATSAYHIVVTFLAILEMAKVRVVRVYQPDPESAIHLEYRVLDADEEGATEGAEGQSTPEADPSETSSEVPSQAPAGDGPPGEPPSEPSPSSQPGPSSAREPDAPASALDATNEDGTSLDLGDESGQDADPSDDARPSDDSRGDEPEPR